MTEKGVGVGVVCCLRVPLTWRKSSGSSSTSGLTCFHHVSVRTCRQACDLTQVLQARQVGCQSSQADCAPHTTMQGAQSQPPQLRQPWDL